MLPRRHRSEARGHLERQPIRIWSAAAMLPRRHRSEVRGHLERQPLPRRYGVRQLCMHPRQLRSNNGYLLALLSFSDKIERTKNVHYAIIANNHTFYLVV